MTAVGRGCAELRGADGLPCFRTWGGAAVGTLGVSNTWWLGGSVRSVAGSGSPSTMRFAPARTCSALPMSATAVVDGLNAEPTVLVRGNPAGHMAQRIAVISATHSAETNKKCLLRWSFLSCTRFRRISTTQPLDVPYPINEWVAVKQFASFLCWRNGRCDWGTGAAASVGAAEHRVSPMPDSATPLPRSSRTGFGHLSERF